jgi:hypothetical protein
MNFNICRKNNQRSLKTNRVNYRLFELLPRVGGNFREKDNYEPSRVCGDLRAENMNY